MDDRARLWLANWLRPLEALSRRQRGTRLAKVRARFQTYIDVELIVLVASATESRCRAGDRHVDVRNGSVVLGCPGWLPRTAVTVVVAETLTQAVRKANVVVVKIGQEVFQLEPCPRQRQLEAYAMQRRLTVFTI